MLTVRAASPTLRRHCNAVHSYSEDRSRVSALHTRWLTRDAGTFCVALGTPANAKEAHGVASSVRSCCIPASVPHCSAIAAAIPGNVRLRSLHRLGPGAM